MLFEHMNELHHFHIGHVDNLVNVHKLLDLLEEKLSRYVRISISLVYAYVCTLTLPTSLVCVFCCCWHCYCNLGVSRVECIYCEKTFKNHVVLRLHMRKKRHFRLSPRNSEWDQFYLVNYLVCVSALSISIYLDLSTRENRARSDLDANRGRPFESRFAMICS